MKINNATPSFGCRLRIDVEKEPEQLITVMGLAMNQHLKVTDSLHSSKSEDILSYQIQVPDELSNSLKSYLAQNNIEYIDLD